MRRQPGDLRAAAGIRPSQSRGQKRTANRGGLRRRGRSRGGLRRRGTSDHLAEDQQAFKKQRTEEERNEESEGRVEGLDGGSGTGEEDPSKLLWCPPFFTLSGKPITEADCSSLNADVAFGLLTAATLPKDRDLITPTVEEAIAEMGQYGLMIGQRAVAFYSKHLAHQRAMNDLRGQLDKEMERTRSAEEELSRLRTSLATAEGLRGEAEQKQAAAEQKVKDLETELQGERDSRENAIKEAEDRGYNQGIDDATVSYTGQIKGITADWHRISYSDGFVSGYECLLGKVDLPEDSELRNVPEPPPEEGEEEEDGEGDVEVQEHNKEDDASCAEPPNEGNLNQTA